MHIINIGTPVMHSEKDKISTINFNSGVTFLDADVIFWDIASSFSNFLLGVSGNEKSIQGLKGCIKKRKQELDEFFKIGRTVFITSPVFERREYTIGESNTKEYIDLIDCFDIAKPKYEKVTGQNVQPISEPFVDSFYLLNSNRFFYDLKLVKSRGIPLMHIKETNYVVSEFYRIKNGLLVILPRIKFNPRPENDSKQFLASISTFIGGLKEYKVQKPHEIPEWVDNYTISGEKSEKKRNESLKTQLHQLEIEIKECESNLADYKFLKALFASDGDTLEDAVNYILQDIDFVLEKPDGNRDDLILKWEDKVAVIEIKGLTKSAAEKNAAQLQKWVSNYHFDNDLNPKGILIANTFKNTSIDERKGNDFPQQMLPFAEQMKHCLITGIQLLCIYLDFKTGILKQDEIGDLLFNTIGVLTYKENPAELIEKL